MADPTLTVLVQGKDDLSQELKRIESGVIRFVGAISSAATAVAAIGFPIVQAAQFQKELLNAAKTTDFSREQLGVLKAGLKDLSTQISVTAVDLAKIATMGGQIGIGARGPAALVEFTKTVSTAVVALDLSAEEVVASFGKLINIFNIPPDQFRNAMSALNEVSNVSNATADQLFDVVRRIGNVGGSLNLPQAAALSATMIDLGLTAETAGTTITKIFADFKSNAEEFAAVVKSETIPTTADWINLVAKDGLGALTAYVDALNKLAPQEAARLQGRLTGEGRLFEAINKLREQRSREVDVIKQAQEAERQLSDIQSGRVQANEEEIRGLKLRVDALREASVQANVLRRLQRSAETQFRTGTSAEKEQQTMLASLSNQWQVFLNNISALATAAGEVFLPPLTNALKGMSEALRDPINADSLRRAAEDILEAIYAIIEAIKDLSALFKGLKSADFDWGALLRSTVLIAAYAAIKGLISLLKVLGTTFVTAVPGVNALGVALFGSVQNADKAGKSLDKAGASAERSGGLFNKAATSLRNGIAASASASAELVATQTQIDRIMGKVSARMAETRTQMDGLFSGNRMAPFRAMTTELARYHALLKAVTQAEQANAAARAAGQSLRGTSSNLTYLRNQLNAYEQLRARMLQLQRLEGSLGQRQTQIQATFDNAGLIGQVNRTVARIRQAGERAGIEFSYAFSTGAQRGVTGMVVDTVGRVSRLSAATASAGLKAGTAFANGFKSAASNATTALEMVVGRLGAIGPAATAATSRVTALGAALRSLTVPDISGKIKDASLAAAGAVNRTGGGLFSAAAAAASVAATALSAGIGAGFTSLKKKIGDSILDITGYGEAWRTSATRSAKAITGLGIAFSLLGKAVSGVFRLAMGFLNVYFLGTLIIDVLKAIGVWDTLAEKIQYVIRLLGFEPPSFLNTERQETERAEQIAAIGKAYEGAIKEASKFNKEAQATVILAQDVAAVSKRVTFNPATPQSALRESLNFLDAILAGYSQLNQYDALRFANNEKLQAAVQRLTAAETALQDAIKNNESTVRVAELRGAFDDASLSVNAILDDLQKLRDQKQVIGDIAAATRNWATQTFTGSEAEAFFGTFERGGLRSLSVIQQLVRNREEILRLTNEQKQVEEKLAVYRDTGGGNAPNRTEAGYLSLQASLKGLSDQLEVAQKRQDALRNSIAQTSQGGTYLVQVVDRLISSLDSDAVRQFSDTLTNSFKELGSGAFKGLRVPQIKGTDILSTGAEYAVNTRIASMYRQWASAAQTAAERAKNYATQVAGEVEKMFRNVQVWSDKLDQTVAAKRQQAKYQTVNREEERASRARLLDLDIEYERERELLELRFQGTAANNRQRREAFSDLEEYYRRQRELEQDRVSTTSQKRVVQDELKQFDQLVAKVNRYQEAVDEANKVLNDPRATADKQLAALERRSDALEKMRSLLGIVSDLGDKIISTEPVGGQYLVTDQQIAKVKQGVTQVSETLAAASLKDKDKLESVYTTIFNKLSESANKFGADAEAAFGKFIALVQGKFGEKAVDPAITAMSQLIASTQTFSSLLDTIQDKTNRGLVSPGTIDLQGIPQAVDTLTKALSGQTFSLRPNLKLDATQNNFAKELEAQFRDALQKTGGTGVTANVNARISSDSIAEMNKQVVDGVRPNIKGTLTITNQPEVIVKGKLVTEPVGPGSGNARGGLIGEAISLASLITGFARGGYAATAPERLVTPLARTVSSLASQIVLKPISNFATGGATPTRAANKVRGPGTGTSDSILSWLSNGEYVIDALTTARFGPDFFRKLQMAARGGASTRVLREINIPKFADGGVVVEPILNLPDAANNPQSSVVAEHALSLTINGKAAGRLRGSRETVKNLVLALKEIERGVS